MILHEYRKIGQVSARSLSQPVLILLFRRKGGVLSKSKSKAARLATLAPPLEREVINMYQLYMTGLQLSPLSMSFRYSLV